MYCTQPYPKVIGWQQFQNTITTTNAAAAVPLQVASATSFIAPFIVPAGPTRLVRIEANLAFLGSSAAAGTTLTVTAQATNAGQTYGVGIVKVAVASDGTVMFTTGVVATPPGTYYAQLLWQQGAAGTMTAGAAYLNSNIAVEFV
jgi:lipoprotein-anchoring transpeptidase ErfK/SrfK